MCIWQLNYWVDTLTRVFSCADTWENTHTLENCYLSNKCLLNKVFYLAQFLGPTLACFSSVFPRILTGKEN